MDRPSRDAADIGRSIRRAGWKADAARPGHISAGTVIESTEGKGGEGLSRVELLEPDNEPEEIPCDEFSRIFENRKLVFLHQDRTEDGGAGRPFSLVGREG